MRYLRTVLFMMILALAAQVTTGTAAAAPTKVQCASSVSPPIEGVGLPADEERVCKTYRGRSLKRSYVRTITRRIEGDYLVTRTRVVRRWYRGGRMVSRSVAMRVAREPFESGPRTYICHDDVVGHEYECSEEQFRMYQDCRERGGRWIPKSQSCDLGQPEPTVCVDWRYTGWCGPAYCTNEADTRSAGSECEGYRQAVREDQAARECEATGGSWSTARKECERPPVVDYECTDDTTDRAYVCSEEEYQRYRSCRDGNGRWSPEKQSCTVPSAQRS